MRMFAALAVLLLCAACASPSDQDSGASSGDDTAETPAIGEMGGMCGGIASFQCKDEAAYCKVEPGVCRKVADYAGTCTKRPEVCTMEYKPVCGCDNKTYGNACSAAGKGVSVAYEGECTEE